MKKRFTCDRPLLSPLCETKSQDRSCQIGDIRAQWQFSGGYIILYANQHCKHWQAGTSGLRRKTSNAGHFIAPPYPFHDLIKKNIFTLRWILFCSLPVQSPQLSSGEKCDIKISFHFLNDLLKCLSKRKNLLCSSLRRLSPFGFE